MMEAIFLRPSSPPSFCSRSRAGMAIVSSWMMMEALMYGWMDSANIVAIEKLPPDMVFQSPSIVLLTVLK